MNWYSVSSALTMPSGSDMEGGSEPFHDSTGDRFGKEQGSVCLLWPRQLIGEDGRHGFCGRIRKAGGDAWLHKAWLARPWEEFIDFKPVLATPLYRKIFERSYAYFSKDLKNVQRDWTKVTAYGKRLGVLDNDFVPNYTNEFLEWNLEADSKDPTGDQKRMAKLQEQVAVEGGFHRLGAAVEAA